jgi:uncharacterized repeat protein (TIGR01451 family)
MPERLEERTLLSGLSLSKAVSQAQVSPGGDLTYSLQLTNTDVVNAVNPTVIDPLPVRTTFVSSTEPVGWTVTSGPTTTFAAPTLAAGATANFTILVSVGSSVPSGTVLSDAGSASSANLPTVSSNTVSTTVVAEPLVVSVFPIVGTEGKDIPAAPIATFVDHNGVHPIADYSATINITDPSGTVLSFSPTSITQNDGAAQYTVNAPAITLPEEGTYQVVVSVTQSSLPITVSGASFAVIADAALTAGATVSQSGNTGIALSGIGVGSFTDANPTATTGDFTATILWGDGTAASAGKITQPGGAGTAFDVAGSHVYGRPGVYTVTTHVVDDGGASTTLTATFTITDNAISGATHNFTAVEGQNTGEFVLATYTDPNTLATVANENATLAVGGWGDGTPGVAGITLTVQQIGVTPLTSPTNPGAPIFAVLGSHVYAEETATGTPNPLSVIITTLGGTTTTLTSASGTGVTVLDARLTSSNGTEITAVEGTATGALLLGTFTDANQAATNADFTTGGGSVVVNWGDGSAPETLTVADVTASGSPDGVIFSVTGAHTYSEAGTFAYTVTVKDDGGATTIISGSAIIADAPLIGSATQPTVSTTEASLFPVPVFAPPLFKGPVASFIDGDTSSTAADFTTLIDWGDGTPMTAGTVSQPGGVGSAFIVSGSHTYADSGVNGGDGKYAIQVFVQDDDGSRQTITNTATVADDPILLTGALNPASDSGLSTGTINTTNIVQPVFGGTSEPLSHVTLFATALPGGSPAQIGQTRAGSDGSWKITASVPLADGHYEITATAVDQFGVTHTAAPTVITANLLIDTKGPVIDGLFFNRLNGQVDYIIKDPVPPSGGAPSGVWVNGLLDSSNYLLTKVHANKAYPGKWIVTNVTATPDPTIPFAYDVAVTFNSGAILKGGYYLFTIRDSSNGNSSVQDLAENHLDGVFYGSFPSGNGINGSDFVAELQAEHNKVFAPQSVLGTSSAANGGAGGTPVGAIHSGVFVPAVPRGGSPIFSTPTSPSNGGDPPAPGHAAKKIKGHAIVKPRHPESRLSAGSPSKTRRALVVGRSHPAGPRRK